MMTSQSFTSSQSHKNQKSAVLDFSQNPHPSSPSFQPSSLTHLKDQELLSQTQNLVQKERGLLTTILHHLREVERRKLFSDLGYKSLFEYSVKELKYSEGQAGRRIQAMRLLKELPALENKIASGSLSLSNLSQAQSYFREVKKSSPQKPLPLAQKAQILKSLENKSAREGQKELLKLQPHIPLPKERERVVSEDHIELKLVLHEGLKKQLQEVKALLGPKAQSLSWSELIQELTKISLQTLKEKKFGQRRSKNQTSLKPTPTSESGLEQSTPGPSLNPRYIPKKIKYQVWLRDQGQCQKCQSRNHLNYDHIQPVALGGKSHLKNLRLLCFHCNQRRAIKSFGVKQRQ